MFPSDNTLAGAGLSLEIIDQRNVFFLCLKFGVEKSYQPSGTPSIDLVLWWPWWLHINIDTLQIK